MSTPLKSPPRPYTTPRRRLRCLQLAEAAQRSPTAPAGHGAIYAVVSALLRYPMTQPRRRQSPMLAEVDQQRLEAARKRYAAHGGRRRGLAGMQRPADRRRGRSRPSTPTCWCWASAAPTRTAVDVPADLVSSVLIASGRSAIVLPHIATTPAKLERVLIA